MELGRRLKQARLEAGLSQRQLCGEEITRNMLSQIENGSARPSMDTLRYFAQQLGKPLSWFLEEETVSPNQALMTQARQAYSRKEPETVLQLLKDYVPDGTFDAEQGLLRLLCLLDMAELALQQGKTPYAISLLEQAEQVDALYRLPALTRRQTLLQAQAQPEKAAQLLKNLPTDDTELLLRAEVAQQQLSWQESAALLEAAQDKSGGQWLLLRGKACMGCGEYEKALELLQQVQPAPYQLMEQCCVELGDYKLAYHYAKEQGK